MRFRIHKRKVAILFVLLTVAGIATWNVTKARKQAPRESPKNAVATEQNRILSEDRDEYDYFRGRDNVSSNFFDVKIGVKNTSKELKKYIYYQNFYQFIRNSEKIKAPAKDGLVILVQVHNRPQHLKLLVESLRKAQRIEEVLLVLSHDYISEEVNEVVRTIDFCRVLQIFFPFSLQVYPNEFPGQDPNDCPRDISLEEARRLKCNNAEFPDKYAHYREAVFTQTKHHWWWKLHFVWDRLNAINAHDGLVLLIEEDHYLLPDFYVVLQKMWDMQKRECPDCDILSLGSYDMVDNFEGKSDKLEGLPWQSSRHNMGMAIGRLTYKRLLACTQEFCTYDDYNWDWTLQHLTVACLPHPLKALVLQAPRVCHTGGCGMHHQGPCDAEGEARRLAEHVAANAPHLYPTALQILQMHYVSPINPHTVNGGWGDKRDHALCQSYRQLR
ncbi:unnamed protein product [Lampetra fluviatilis]